ncbi:hypothetical protein C351_04609 [Cryptococcus neoformans c8]|nr:hypothetical protein C351_04609 [Cryptococcus neoformans var. grubii c8]OXH08336.1 hypothetical protein C370_04775 [Cryptococcus neoformans var. grubii A1-35-8]
MEILTKSPYRDKPSVLKPHVKSIITIKIKSWEKKKTNKQKERKR